MAAHNRTTHKALEDRILAGLHESDPSRRELVTGGHTADQIAAALGVTVQTIRRTLQDLSRRGLTCSFAPRKHEREDGKTGMTLVWFKTTAEYRRRFTTPGGGRGE
jgi:predicted ArsR family transcriptional regulator